jgi:mono/diheme cytochrome c family protein
MTMRILSVTLLAGAAAFGMFAVITSASVPGESSDDGLVARGKYLVEAIGCADCHTPLLMGPNGPVRDSTRQLSGHPQGDVMPAAPKLPPGPWLVTGASSLTAWSGPWGTSFTANLTPDKETGLGNWTGRGRPLLPPMPAEFYANLSDEDLRALFAYLQSIPAVSNRVPEPLPPAE